MNTLCGYDKDQSKNYVVKVNSDEYTLWSRKGHVDMRSVVNMFDEDITCG